MGWHPSSLKQCLWRQVKCLEFVKKSTFCHCRCHNNHGNKNQEVPARGVACNTHGSTFNSCHLCHHPCWSQGSGDGDGDGNDGDDDDGDDDDDDDVWLMVVPMVQDGDGK